MHRTRAGAGTVSSAGPVQAGAVDWATGCGSEAECDEACSWTSPTACAEFPTRGSWIHSAATDLQVTQIPQRESKM